MSPGVEDRVAARLAQLERAAGGRESESVVEEALADASLVVRARAAAVAAQRLSARRLVELVAQGDSLARRSAAMDALARAGRRGLGPVLAGARSASRDEARFCLQVLGRIAEPEARALLREMAAHPDRELRQVAFEALGLQRDAEAVPALLAALRGDPWTAFAAIWALGEIGDLRAVPALKALRGQEAFQQAIDTALARIPGAEGAAHA